MASKLVPLAVASVAAIALKIAFDWFQADQQRKYFL